MTRAGGDEIGVSGDTTGRHRSTLKGNGASGARGGGGGGGGGGVGNYTAAAATAATAACCSSFVFRSRLANS